MQTIIIKLIPGKLDNPDLDLRYVVADSVEKVSNGMVRDDGYDYLDGQDLGLWFAAESAEQYYPMVIKLLREERFLENDLSASAEIYISEMESDEMGNCKKVFPE